MNKTSSELNRRNFLKIAGAGSLALALPALDQLAVDSSAGNYTNFHFLAVNEAIDGDDVHNILVAGHGKITRGNAVGNGSFSHQLVSAPGLPKPILAEGTWKAKRLVSFDVLGTYGIVVSGVVTMEVHLVPNDDPVIPAMLEVVCNVPPAGLFTGKPEGYVLDTGGPPGPFTPKGPPPVGITWFTRSIESKD